MIIFWLVIILFLIIAMSFVLMPLLATDVSTLSSERSNKLAFFLVFIFPLLALLLYMNWGDSGQLKQYLLVKKENAMAAQLRDQLGTPQQIILQLKQHLQNDPGSAKGWFLLGRLYISQQQCAQASAAFARANNLSPHQPDILLNYAEALALQNNAQFNQTAITMLQEVLQLTPDNDEARNLLAISAYQHHDYQTAIHNWEIILPHYAVNSAESKTLIAAITKAQQALNKQQNS